MHHQIDKTTEKDYTEYSEFWNSTLSKIENLQKSVIKSTDALDLKYSEFDLLYENLERDIEILMSVYSGFNTVKGNELLQKLHALILKYKKRHTKQAIDFDLIYSLLEKIEKYRKKDFENFPVLEHNIKKQPEKSQYSKMTEAVNLLSRPYKWISFKRNNSWFILPFKSCTVLNSTDFKIVHSEKPDTLWINAGNESIKTTDFFTDYKREYIKPEFIIEINGNRYYTADAIGKKIYSRSDIISPLIKNFRQVHLKSPGRARLFGRNHIVLR